MSKSEKNLWEAFAGESQANRKYLAYAAQAENEKLFQIAKLFRAAAEAETVHALSHLRALGKVKDTAENLQDAIEGETHEFKNMYPAMIDEAKNEGVKAAELTFTYAIAAEEIHADLFRKALKVMRKLEEAGGKPEEATGKLEEVDYHVCLVCGYTCEKEAPEKCPVCGASSKQFKRIS